MNAIASVIALLLANTAFADKAQVEEFSGYFRAVEQATQAGDMYRPPCRFTTVDSVLAPSKYLQCIEPISAEMKSYISDVCVQNGIAKGSACLGFEYAEFETQLKARNAAEYARFIEFKKLNDDGDSQVCVRYVNGSWKRPTKAFLNRTAKLAPFIKATADYYGIPPEAIPCAIGGDATVTSSLYKSQALYENGMIQKDPVKRAGKDFRRMKLNFLSPPRPDKAVGNVTRDEIKSIRAAALLLRHAEALYTEAGFSKDDLPAEVLTSIYHLGAYRGFPLANMATLTMQQQRKPGLSFLGLFCARYKDEFRAILDANAISP